ncbi:MAG: cation:proton antiporter [Leucobacter sp.]
MDLTFFLIPLAAVIAPLIAAAVGRALVVPLIVFEIALGMLLGPSGLGWVQDGAVLESFSQLGLAMLFFMAGNEINLDAVRGRSGGRALGGWVISLLIAAGVGLLFADGIEAVVIIAIALSGTALGTITPILRDAGLTTGPVGRAISAHGAAGEFFPLVAVTVFLTARNPIVGALTLVVFVAAAAFAFYTSARKEQAWLKRMVSATLQTSGQFAVRLVIFVLAGLIALTLALGVDFLLGAFTAGLLCRVLLRGSPEVERRVIETKLEAFAFGFVVPIFFVTTGVTFALSELVSNVHTLLLVPVFAVVILLVRGIPGYFALDRGASAGDRRTVALFAATTLPLVIAVTQIGVDNKVIEPGFAAAMTGGAMLTVLLFPMLGLLGRGRVRSTHAAGAVG